MGLTMGGSVASAAVGTIDSYLGTMKLGKSAAKETQSADDEAAKPLAQASTAQQMGDRVDVSPEGQQLAKSYAGPRDINKGVDEEKSEEEEEDVLVKDIKERIKQIQAEIKELEQSDLPEKEKQQKIAMLTQEMALQTEMLQKAQDAQEKLDTRYGKGGLKF